MKNSKKIIDIKDRTWGINYINEISVMKIEKL